MKCGLYFFMEKPEPSTETNADQVGGKVGKDADVSEWRRPQGDGMEAGDWRNRVQVRELAKAQDRT